MKRELLVFVFLCCLLISLSAGYCEASSTSRLNNSRPAIKNMSWDEATPDLKVYRRGKAIYGGSDLIPRKPAKSRAQSSLIRPASRLISSTLLSGSAIIVLCCLI